MSNCLKDRSLVDRVFVSYSSNAGDRIHVRDKNQDKKLENGNTKDMLTYLKNNEKVCLVVIDFAGLSTNTDDLQQSVSISDHESLQKIIVDTLPFNNRVFIFDRPKLLAELQTLKAFECRNRPLRLFFYVCEYA
ncbi:uncharacterized protein EV154DRAFT_535614 [Mucor mucedo]|uniref:uncharacterized protein n=1 Tax=Mucor mucedo TaxID=29922 RepID=UPI00221F813B|nr:uncharacterized protein EV154DRAFT_535614 [Mucor mucedo]KAI7896656.1 hypothetical protein EV154DRAFT_535614 [Mucor mucedo]